MRLYVAGWLEKFQCDSDVVQNLASLDLELVTDDHLFAAQTAVLQWLSDNWWG